MQNVDVLISGISEYSVFIIAVSYGFDMCNINAKTFVHLSIDYVPKFLYGLI